jgi:N-acetylmuramoyl-L-alanine amidase
MKRFLHTPTGICIHHSATIDSSSANDTEAFRRYHKNVNGWDEIGYHFVVERFGSGPPQVMVGRQIEYQGAHCPELNATHIGICLAGNFDLYAPDADMLASLEGLCRRLMASYHIPAHEVTYHCQYSTKTCPGKKFPQSGFLLALAGEKRP